MAEKPVSRFRAWLERIFPGGYPNPFCRGCGRLKRGSESLADICTPCRTKGVRQRLIDEIVAQGRGYRVQDGRLMLGSQECSQKEDDLRRILDRLHFPYDAMG